MNLDQLIDHTKSLSRSLDALTHQAHQIENSISDYAQTVAQQVSSTSQGSPLIMELTVLTLAIFVGYHIVWRVTPALHSPLMAITNAVSSVIIVGAILAAGLPNINGASILGFFAVILASINIFGGFVVTQRMLNMFSNKKSKN